VVRQTKSTEVHFETQKLFLSSVAACVKTPTLPPNLIIQWSDVDELKPLIIGDEVTAT